MGSRKPLGVSEDSQNLVNLPSFNEDEVTSSLRDFYQQDVIYTRIGTRTLVSLNPYRPLNCYNETFLQRYLSDYKDISGQRQILPPHIFETISNAYLDMRRTGYDQCVVFSGETGSGKSYTKSMGLRMLVALREASKKDSHIMGQIMDATSILEAFGNAHTLHNNNASRYGNYTEIQFNERGRIIGAKILDYLMEKSRVVSSHGNESNFHIFYYLLSGISDEERGHLKLEDTNTYLANGPHHSEQDTVMFNALRSAMKSIGFNKKYQSQIFRLLAAILHLGNISFMDHPNRPNEATSIKNEDVQSIVAEFLGVNASDLANVLTYRSTMIRKEICTTFLNAKMAEVQRDSLSKALYSLLFSWIVEFINTKLCSDTQTNFIGFVDMPGFQSFESNGFEQFCVNFTNERIHNFINYHIFETTNEEYREQGIAIPEVLYFDNSPCLDLFMKPNSGLIALMDKKTHRSQTDISGDSLLETFRKHNTSHSNFHPPPKGSHGNFAIQHFAGQVAYHVSEFSEKNNDTIGSDFIGLFRGGADVASTSNPFIAGLFSDKTVAYESHPRNESTIVAAQAPAIPTRQPSMRRSRTKTGKETKKVTGVTTQLKGALDELVETLQETVPWFVLCIRPNDTQKSGQFDSRKVKLQVRYMGLAEIANRRQIDYTTSLTHDEFLDRYAMVIEPMGLDQTRGSKQKCQTTCTIFGWNEKEMAVGATKVYLGFEAWRDLEDNLRLLEADSKKRKKEVETSSPRDSVERPISPSAMPTSFRSIASPTLHDSQSFATSVDTRSFYSDDDYFERSENQSAMTSEIFTPQPTLKNPESSKIEMDLPIEEKEPVSKQRKRWICCTWSLTWWVPTFALTTCGKMKRPDIRMAWREKTALCILILFFCAIVVFFLMFFGQIICPRQHVFSDSELASYSTKDNPYLSIQGEVFTFKDYSHHGVAFDSMKEYAGRDASLLFPMQLNMLCEGFDGPIHPAISLYNYSEELNSRYHDYRFSNLGNDYVLNDFYSNNVMAYLRHKKAKGQMAYSTTTVRKKGQSGQVIGIINNKVYDLNSYASNKILVIYPPNYGDEGNVKREFMDPELVNIFKTNKGEDVTANVDALYRGQEKVKADMLNCLQNLFYIGVVDTRNSPQCLFSNYILLAATIFMTSILLFKFLAALQLGSVREPEDHDKFVVCQVPCYTEGEESLKKTIDSLAVLKYDDKRKLLFVVADGMIIGGGNDKPTPMIVLDILGADPNVEPEPLAYKALGEGNQQLNMGKVYTGLYECSGHVVPYIVVVKIGKPSERSRPGNRGKRDSQLILMQFFNKVHFNTEMTPLELEMYHQIKNVIGVDPFFYEYVLMVDADTIVLPDSLNRMISCMLNDTKIMGLCGETQLLNEKASFITMIQVYEYFISHHLNKAFESLFGSVTCLPGCFCMYRFRTPIKNQPLLVANVIIEEYSENKVDTLHKKNLLSLGEDRYLTTLMLKHFNYNKMTFTPDAKCQTNAPDEWSVLLSQRRRWINSTIHNLAELLYLPRLCGFCCFSMRFVVFVDLLSTIIMPVQCFYLGYLLYKVITDPSSFPLISIIMLAAIYGFQIFIFLIKRQWQHVGWMIVYLISLPIFSFFLPVYAFWHFDDFSWGNTRVVVGEKGKVAHISTEEKFDPASVPLKKWSDYEQELWEVGTHISHESKGSSPSNRESYRSRSKSRAPDNSSVYTSMVPASTHSIPDPYLSSGIRGRSVSPAPQSVHALSPYPPGPMTVRNQSHSMDRNSRAYSVARSDYRDYSRSRGPTLDVPGYNHRASNASSISPSMMGGHMNPGYHPMQPLGSRPGSVVNVVSDHEIMEEIRHILSTANLMSITKKQVRDELARHFGMDMTHKKEYINNCIDMILQGQL